MATTAANSTPIKEHCKYYVARKKRYCRLSPNEGEEYCAEHKAPEDLDVNEIASSSKDLKVRIACPLDNKHTCFAHKLNKHLKICNARKGTLPEFIRENVNSGRDEAPDLCTRLQPLSSLSPCKIKCIIEKVKNIHKEHVEGKIAEQVRKHVIVENEMETGNCGNKTKKHLKQVSSILKLLEECDLMNDNTCFLEFGAGRGQLSYWIAKACSSLQGISILLVEKASPKHKHDNKLSKHTDEEQLQIQRIRADIRDLVLDRVDGIKNSSSIVAVTKHLCGNATDLSLRCINNIQENRQKVKGIVMTFCCHHRCEWTPYVGKTFFERVGLDQTDFQIMCSIASWATCGTGFSREVQRSMDELDLQNKMHELRNDIGLSRKEKEDIGICCKNIINWGRLVYLESNGFSSRLLHYIDSETSLENVCIIGTKGRKEL